MLDVNDLQNLAIAIAVSCYDVRTEMCKPHLLAIES
jgi:hypothetical protein